MSVILTKYISLLQRRPMITKCVTGAVLLKAGDSICQSIETSKYSPSIQKQFKSESFFDRFR